MKRLLVPAVAVALLAGCAVSGVVQRRLYVATKSGLSVYDIDRGHALIGRIELPDTRNFKGICAAAPSGKLYLTSNQNDELICFDLVSERIVWRRSYGAYADSPAITPDGRVLYLACRHAGEWWAIDAAGGGVLAKIRTGRGAPYSEGEPIKDYGPHNTVCGGDGARMFLGAMTIPYVFVADTASHEIVRRIGPFGRGVRPFAVSPDEAFVFTNVDGLLGFEVADAVSGRVLHRVEARVPAERVGQVKDLRPHHHTPSHGIALRPGTSELWVSDDVHGYLYVYDVSSMPPRHVADVPLFSRPAAQPKPGWISFSIDGRYAYASCNAVVDAETRAIAARIDTSERMLEVQFLGGRPVRAGRR